MICTGCGKPLTYPFCSAAVITGSTVHQPISNSGRHEMTQEWALPRGATEAFERETERQERQMIDALPDILHSLMFDLFDQFAPARDADLFYDAAYRAAAENVVGNLNRLIAEDEATIAQIRQLQAVGSTPEGQKDA